MLDLSMHFSKRRTVAYWLAAVAIALVAWRTYQLFAMPSFDPPTGDGRFENHSWRFPRKHFGVPIPGYMIYFDEFDLGRDFAATYRIGDLPQLARPVVVYLCIRDPLRTLRSDDVREQLTSDWVMEVFDEEGTTVANVKLSLGELIWADPQGGADTYGLYDLDGSRFEARAGETYEIRVRYAGNPKLVGFTGFVFIRCGGSI